MKNRGEIELVAFIIQAAISGATMTRIMHKVCLPYNQLKNYLVILRENDMLTEHSNEEQTFIATDKGIYFLHMYMELNGLATTITGKRNIIPYSHYGLLANACVIRHAINCIQYLIIIVRSMI